MFTNVLLITAIVTPQHTMVDYKLYDNLQICEQEAENVALTVKEQQEIHCICVEVEEHTREL